MQLSLMPRFIHYYWCVAQKIEYDMLLPYLVSQILAQQKFNAYVKLAGLVYCVVTERKHNPKVIILIQCGLTKAFVKKFIFQFFPF